MVGSTQAQRPSRTSRGVPRIRSVTSSAPGVFRPSSTMAESATPTSGLPKAAISAWGSSHARAFTFASRVATASAISLPRRGVQIAEMFTHDRPPLAATHSTISSRNSAYRSTMSSPMRILLQPGPCSSTRWSFLYGSVVRESPKSIDRPVPFRMSAAPAWSVGNRFSALAGTPAFRKACSTRWGVHGSSRPGLSTSGVFRAMAGTHSECTPGELLGRIAPNESVVG